MARGNDADAAARELEGQYGDTGNASQLVQAHRLTRPQELRVAQMRTINQEATEKLDLKKVASESGKDKVLDARVRGEFVVYVYEDDRGDMKHGVLKHEGENKLSEVEEEDKDAARLRQHQQDRLDKIAEAQRVDQKADEAAEKARAKAAADAQKSSSTDK